MRYALTLIVVRPVLTYKFYFIGLAEETGFESDESNETDVESLPSSEAGDAENCDQMEANDPLVIQKCEAIAERILSGVCSARCYVCDCILDADRRKQVNFARMSEDNREAVRELLDHLVVEPGEYDLCSTCHSYIVKRQTPPSAAVNGFRYHAMPPGLRPLTEVEEHVLALRLPFQQIMHLGTIGSRGQYGVRGSVVNVPTDPTRTVRTVIPLLPEEDKLCIVNIKRKLVHRRAFARSFVDKKNLIEWGRFLQQSTLYREHRAVFDESRLEEPPAEAGGAAEAEPTSDGEGEVYFGKPDDPDNYEDMCQRMGSIQYSLLMEDRAQPPRLPSPPPPPPSTPRLQPHPGASLNGLQGKGEGGVVAPAGTACPTQRGANPATDEVNVAPGEGNIPISVVWDRKAEELAFPGIYLGEPRTFCRHTTRYRAMKSEVRRFDRRGARPQNLLYKYNVYVREQASGRLRHKFKRGAKTVLGKDITKEQLLDTDFVVTSQKNGLAMPCLLPNSSEYWRARSHDLFAMVRQLGRPHLFLTLSAAEYHWPILLSTLRRLHRQHGEMDRFSAANIAVDQPLPHAVTPEAMKAIEEVLAQNEGEESTFISEEKLRLIREDPVVCAMYFRKMVLVLKKLLRKRKYGPMGRYYMTDWFIRIEFQVRVLCL